jgi:N-acetylglutamate synthase-like GNAT family acetyltransferase
MITLRKARPSDIPELVELLKELFMVEADFYFDPKNKQTD